MNNRTHDLLLIDDIYPSSFSPFRTTEYNHYLWFFDAVALTLQDPNWRIENKPLGEQIAELDLDEAYKSRISDFESSRNIVARLAYVTFLSNARRLLPYFTERNLPFILQLYPGGGFAIGQDSVDATLREVLSSPLCRKVITTQRITREYIIEKIGFDAGKIEYLYGGVFQSNVDFEYTRDKKTFPRDKSTMDICFVAHKYGTDLISKGYDYFVRMALALVPRFEHLNFHVVGNYLASDIPLAAAAERFSFYGRQPQSFFAEFYPKMDAILSFNRPFVLMPGAFDGFPTGACLEAGFRGVANILNDPLKLNSVFVDGADFLLLDDDFEASVGKISALLSDSDRLAALGQGTWRAFHRTMAVDKQLWVRTKLIADELARIRGEACPISNCPAT